MSTRTGTLWCATRPASGAPLQLVAVSMGEAWTLARVEEKSCLAAQSSGVQLVPLLPIYKG